MTAPTASSPTLWCFVTASVAAERHSDLTRPAVLGGFVIWFFWIQAEPLGLWLMDVITSGMDADSTLKAHLIESAAHMRLMTMGLILLLALRFSPRGLIPEKVGRH